jgi:hypothetical protein
MFNYNAEQILVVQPRNAGGGILSFLLSLDSITADITYKEKTVNEKITNWKSYVASPTSAKNAHINGFLNFGHSDQIKNINRADYCNRYIHKCHFFELDGDKNNKHTLLYKLIGPKKSIGIYLTDKCINNLLLLRPTTPAVDFYQQWVYSNQKILLDKFYDIKCQHTFSFSEMLNINLFMDHLTYCNEVLELDLNIDIAKCLIQEWYTIIGHTT